MAGPRVMGLKIGRRTPLAVSFVTAAAACRAYIGQSRGWRAFARHAVATSCMARLHAGRCSNSRAAPAPGRQHTGLREAADDRTAQAAATRIVLLMAGLAPSRWRTAMTAPADRTEPPAVDPGRAPCWEQCRVHEQGRTRGNTLGQARCRTGRHGGRPGEQRSRAVGTGQVNRPACRRAGPIFSLPSRPGHPHPGDMTPWIER